MEGEREQCCCAVGNAEQAEGLVFEQQNRTQGPGRTDLERREEMESRFGEWTKKEQHKCVQALESTWMLQAMLIHWKFSQMA